MEITGKVIHAMQTRSGVSQRTGNQWASRDYVLEIPNGQYKPRNMVFTIFGEDKIKQFALRKDEEVTVHFDFDANEVNGRWFNNIKAYNITRPNQQQVAQQYAAPSSPPPPPQPQQSPEQANGDDDLPF